ncbi:2-amino-4-hydroxy-6-hydroxymethyldihydropteridine diphosphokinase [Thalassotalea sp. PS06]|uniref:2-amino-4-hydroxy-6- hydroxymethyldihydropteridine diphosphokinase n=1 Tax=Thalassotalea sp. PS06 TaxID=2594005 RepID=UPI001162D7EE|nr:2-amino-4-hydroxy-6-hydroxymethyldihydropteridine diphosphokinase [Thalassotalea sp. PS06]QDP02282.1 2-amino-4-hydroxy-6-hydroxymethyldihydropteridine diphosphokinase [Thalassotalea sp. PS06]
MARVFISIGSNIDREAQIIAGVRALRELYGDVLLSSVYECEPVGFVGDHFFNLVAEVQTDVSPGQVGQDLKLLEKEQGRIDFSKKFSARKMDLDILLYDDQVMETPVQIPRDEIPENAYVLWPLSELAPNLVHPVLKKTYQQLWNEYDKNKQIIRKVPFNWPE